MADLAVFTALTFAATWAAWLVSAHLAALPGFGLGGPVFLLGVFAPAIVALSLTSRRGGRAAVGRLLARIGRWNVDGRLYMFALFYMAGTKLILMHASVNNTTNVVPAAFPNAAHPFALRSSFMGWATVAVSWAVAVVLLHQMRREHKSEQSLGASR
jgi:hypothetical protein